MIVNGDFNRAPAMGNEFKNGPAIAGLKTFLFVFNIVFWVTGGVLLAAGIWTEFELYKYMLLSPEFSGTASYVMIGIAALILLVSSFSFTCIINGQPVSLYIYGGLQACIFMMGAGMGAAFACYKYTFSKSLKDGLTQTIIHYDPHKANFDFAQSKLECCGVSNYSDWMRMSPMHVIPISCCLDPHNCITVNYSEVYQRGCYDVILEFIEENMNILLGTAVGAALLPLVGTILACCLATYMKKSEYDAIN